MHVTNAISSGWCWRKPDFPKDTDACVGWKMVFTRRHTLVERVPAVLSNRRTLSIRMVSFYLTCNPPPRAGKRSTPYRERVHRKHQKANHKPLLLSSLSFHCEYEVVAPSCDAAAVILMCRSPYPRPAFKSDGARAMIIYSLSFPFSTLLSLSLPFPHPTLTPLFIF